MGQYVGRYLQYKSDPIPVIEEQSIEFTEPIIYATFRELAIIDTGADVSTIPSRLINDNKLVPRDVEEVEYPDGIVKSCDVFYLKVQITGLASIVERFVNYGLDELILGRNLLNRWRIVLNPAHKRPLPAEEIRIED
jgi:predicted aspartyl protease